MKTIHFLVIFSISLFFCSCSKEPDDKVKNPLDINERENLEVLCKVWGLVKYHHPAFMKDSSRDADADLLDLIPKIMEANVQTRNQILFNWIKELGLYDSSKGGFDQYVRSKRIGSQTTKQEAIVDLFWMENEEILGTKLAAELPKIRYAIRSNRNKYLEQEIGFSFINFLEKGYADLTDPSTEYRLLALFRYWNIIEYFYPVKYHLPRHWDDILYEYIPVFVQATGMLKYRLAVARMIAETCDAMCNYNNIDWVPIFGNHFIYSFTTTFAEERLIVNNAFFLSGSQLKVGDEIVSIGGCSLEDIKSKISEYCSISNHAELLRLVNYWARYTNDPTPLVQFLSDGKLITQVFPTKQIREEPSQTAVSAKAFPVSYTLVEEGDIGYMNTNYFQPEQSSEMMNTFKDTKGIIIDNRGYSSLIQNLAYGYFTNINQVFCEFGIGDIMTPGIFYLYNRSNTLAGINYGTYSGKVVIIVNENTRTEWNTMALQTIPGSITIGSQTPGAIASTATVILPGNISTTMSISLNRYPNGDDAQFNGIRIDIEVKPTIAGIKAGRDELYEKAVELILR